MLPLTPKPQSQTPTANPKTLNPNSLFFFSRLTPQPVEACLSQRRTPQAGWGGWGPDVEALQVVDMSMVDRVSAAHAYLVPSAEREREFVIDNLLVRIHLIIAMIRWTGLAPWEFEFPFPGSLTSTLREGYGTRAPRPHPLNFIFSIPNTESQTPNTKHQTLSPKPQALIPNP